MSATAMIPPPPVKRVLVGGPHRGDVVTCSPYKLTLDIGWLTGHYELRDDGRFHFVSLADQKVPS